MASDTLLIRVQSMTPSPGGVNVALAMGDSPAMAQYHHMFSVLRLSPTRIVLMPNGDNDTVVDKIAVSTTAMGIYRKVGRLGLLTGVNPSTISTAVVLMADGSVSTTVHFR